MPSSTDPRFRRHNTFVHRTSLHKLNTSQSKHKSINNSHTIKSKTRHNKKSTTHKNRNNINRNRQNTQSKCRAGLSQHLQRGSEYYSLQTTRMSWVKTALSVVSTTSTVKRKHVFIRPMALNRSDLFELEQFASHSVQNCLSRRLNVSIFSCPTLCFR